jgi:hypothetical protein
MGSASLLNSSDSSQQGIINIPSFLGFLFIIYFLLFLEEKFVLSALFFSSSGTLKLFSLCDFIV